MGARRTRSDLGACRAVARSTRVRGRRWADALGRLDAIAFCASAFFSVLVLLPFGLMPGARRPVPPSTWLAQGVAMSAAPFLIAFACYGGGADSWGHASRVQDCGRAPWRHLPPDAARCGGVEARPTTEHGFINPRGQRSSN